MLVAKLLSEKDPRVYATKLPPCPPEYKRILGVDLGTNCGVAFCDIIPGRPNPQPLIVAGQWNLSLGPYDSGPLRHVRLKQFLAVLAPQLILYEEVKYDPPLGLGLSVGAVLARVATSAEFLGGLKTTLAVWAEEHGIPAQGIAIAQIKKHATGKGNAGKPDMIRAANEKFGLNLETEDYEKTGADNIADAVHICHMGLELYSEGLA
jgi:hypothetical protein